MNRWFYTKLAINNIQKNARTYLPYILASSATVMMFYNMLYLLFSDTVGSMNDSATLRYVLLLGSVVTGIFSFILLTYINSFLIKRRKKEFGLFNILGMEKKHISRIMLLETIMVGLLCIGLGLFVGVLFSKIALLLLLNILQMDVSFGFEVPVVSVVITVLLFGAAFMVNLIYNVLQVHVSKPIELLKGGNVGEQEPRTKWLMALIGTAALGGGYYIAITTKSPLAALTLFFVAVILVIIGTYCLFTAGSIAILKAVRRNKTFYYRTNPFIAISGMIYRMKQNAAGLASICILSTAVIIMLSSTVSLYTGMEDVLRTRYMRDVTVSANKITDAQVKQIEEAVSEATKEAGLVPHHPLQLRSVAEPAIQQNHKFHRSRSVNYTTKNATLLTFMTVEEYNRLEGAQAVLAEDEALVHVIKGDIPGNTLDFNGFTLNIHTRLDKLAVAEQFNIDAMMPGSYVVITANEQVIHAIRQALLQADDIEPSLNYMYLFDTLADPDIQINLVSALNSKLNEMSIYGYANGREAAKHSFLTVYGVLFFLGLFLGALFILGTVLIIYYKQITEGYDDKERFAIMLKVGLSHEEIKKTIRFQVLSVFFLPLVMAVIHIAAAFPFISKLLALFNMTNIPLFARCTALTILVFGVCYALIYAFTARAYYRIVR